MAKNNVMDEEVPTEDETTEVDANKEGIDQEPEKNEDLASTQGVDEEPQAEPTPEPTPVAAAPSTGPRDQSASIAEYQKAMQTIPQPTGPSPAGVPAPQPSANQAMMAKLAELQAAKGQPDKIDQLLQARKDAQNTSFLNNLKERLIDTGATAGGLKYTPNNALGEDAIKNADLDIQNATERPVLEEADPNSAASKAAQELLHQRFPDMPLTGASAATIYKLLPALRSLGTAAKAQQTQLFTRDSHEPVIALNGHFYKNNKDGTQSEVSSDNLEKTFAPKNIIDTTTGINKSVQGTTSGNPKVTDLTGPAIKPEEATDPTEVYNALNPKQRILVDNAGKEFSKEKAKDLEQLDKANSIAKEVNLALTNPAAKTELSVRLGQFLTGGKVTQGEALGLFLHRGGVFNKVNDYLQEMQSGTLVPQHAQELIQVFNQYAKDTENNAQNRALLKAKQLSNKIPGFEAKDLAPLIYDNSQTSQANQSSAAPTAPTAQNLVSVTRKKDGVTKMLPPDAAAKYQNNPDFEVK